MAVAAALGACGGDTAGGGEANGGDASPTPQLAAFDVSNVAKNFSDECKDPDARVLLDEFFCEQVKLDQLSGEGAILRVPTTLASSGMGPRAEAICALFAVQHFDGATADPLGYDTIGILDRDGGNAAACAVR